MGRLLAVCLSDFLWVLCLGREKGKKGTHADEVYPTRTTHEHRRAQGAAAPAHGVENEHIQNETLYSIPWSHVVDYVVLKAVVPGRATSRLRGRCPPPLPCDLFMKYKYE